VSEAQEIVDYDWLIPSRGERLHHVTLPDDVTDLDDIAFAGGPLTAACGRRLKWAVIPGVFTRMGAMRCTGCCRARHLPQGKGSPKNDDDCRRLLGLEPSRIAATAIATARHRRTGGTA
jgi:hypothetical protein